MEQKLTISDIEYAYNLAEHKTDEELAAILKKPVAMVQMLFAIMAGLPKRPWEKIVLPDLPAVTTVAEAQPVVVGKKPKALKPLKVGKKKNKASAKKKAPAKEKAGNKPLSAHAQEMDRLKARKISNRNSIYATRPLDLTGKVRVKLNSRTEVWVEPGTDIEKLKKKLNIA